jgi:hypothetical protein
VDLGQDGEHDVAEEEGVEGDEGDERDVSRPMLKVSTMPMKKRSMRLSELLPACRSTRRRV